MSVARHALCETGVLSSVIGEYDTADEVTFQRHVHKQPPPLRAMLNSRGQPRCPERAEGRCNVSDWLMASAPLRKMLADRGFDQREIVVHLAPVERAAREAEKPGTRLEPELVRAIRVLHVTVERNRRLRAARWLIRRQAPRRPSPAGARPSRAACDGGIRTERESEKLEQRRHVALEAACGISTAELTKIAALPVHPAIIDAFLAANIRWQERLNLLPLLIPGSIRSKSGSRDLPAVIGKADRLAAELTGSVAAR
jgi:hypothetical protein